MYIFNKLFLYFKIFCYTLKYFYSLKYSNILFFLERAFEGFFVHWFFCFVQKGRLYYTHFIGKMQIELCIRLAYVEGVVEMYDATIPRVISRARKACLQWFMCFHFAESVAFAMGRSAWLLLLDKHVKALVIPTWS